MNPHRLFKFFTERIRPGRGSRSASRPLCPGLRLRPTGSAQSITRLLILTLATLLPSFFSQPTLATSPRLDRPLEIEVLENGNLLVTDGGGSDWTTQGSEIFIFDRDGHVQWHFNQNLKFAHSAHLFSNNQIIITDTTNDRLLAVDFDTQEITWTSNDWNNGTGQLSDGSHLDYPNEALELENNHLLVTDRNNNRLLEIDSNGHIFWQHTGLTRPHNTSQLPDGNYLVSDSESHRVVKLSPQGHVLWEYSGGDNPLKWPRDVKLLPSGNYLITDTRNHRVLEVNSKKEIVWEYSQGLYWPYEAERLKNGHTLISDSQNGRLVEVSPDKQIVWQLQKPIPQNLQNFQNGGFEKLQENNPPGWTKADLLAEGTGELSLDQQITHSGKNSARLDYQGQGHLFWLQKVPVTPGKEYHFSGWVKSSLANHPQSWTRFELWWETANGGFVDPPLISEKSFGQTDWVKREWTGLAPEGAVAANLRALTTGSGTSWVDDISWQESRANQSYFIYTAIGFLAIIIAYQIFTRLKKTTPQSPSLPASTSLLPKTPQTRPKISPN